MLPQLVLQTLKHVWVELASRGFSPIIAGGLALPVWNYPRSSQDIDLLLVTANEERLLQTCKELRCQPKSSPLLKDLGSVKVLQTLFRPDDFDVQVAIF